MNSKLAHQKNADKSATIKILVQKNSKTEILNMQI